MPPRAGIVRGSCQIYRQGRDCFTDGRAQGAGLVQASGLQM